MQLKNIAITGPGGNVGAGVIQELKKYPEFTVTALVRPSSKYTPLDGVKVIHVDFSDASSVVKALQGQDAIVGCLPGGSVRFATEKLFIDSAIEAGVKLFFANEFVSNVLGSRYAMFPPEFVGDKIQVRHYLEEKAKEGKIAYTALNGGPFFDMWLLKGPAGFNIAERKATIYGTGNNPSCWTPLSVAFTAVVTMLRNPEPILNRGIFICGVKDVTQNALLAALEAELGQKFEVEHVDIKPYKQEALKLFEEGDFRGGVRKLAIYFNFNEEDSEANFWDKVDNELLGIKVMPVREAVALELAQAKLK